MPTKRMTESILDQKIAKAQSDLDHLKKMKLVLVQQRLAALQQELASLQSGSSAPKAKGRPTKAAAAAAAAASADAGSEGLAPAPKRRKKGRGSRGPRLSEGDALARLSKVVKSAGPEGISGRQAAIEAGIFYLRALKVLRKNFTVRGSGKWTRFSMK
jgi:hypothetical protein